MEIDRNLKKEIKEYLIRLILFCLVVKYYIFYFLSLIVSNLFIIPILLTALVLENKCNFLCFFDFFSGCIVSEDSFACVISFLNFWLSINSCATFYILAKVFGIFKKLDRINFFVVLIFIAILSQILVWLGTIDFLMEKEFYKDGIEYSWSMYTLVPAFLFYKFFAFLTKKFPVPFEKIGYYFSIEFYKELCSRVKKRIKKSN